MYRKRGKYVNVQNGQRLCILQQTGDSLLGQSPQFMADYIVHTNDVDFFNLESTWRDRCDIKFSSYLVASKRQ